MRGIARPIPVTTQRRAQAGNFALIVKSALYQKAFPFISGAIIKNEPIQRNNEILCGGVQPRFQAFQRGKSRRRIR